MISDFVFKNIDESIGRGLSKKQSIYMHNDESHLSCKPNLRFNVLTKELIKEKLPNLIRKNSEYKFYINQSRPKSPSPISQSKLKMVLEQNKRREMISVIKKSTTNSIKNATFQQKIEDKYQRANDIKIGSRFDDNKQNNRVNCYQNQRKFEQQKAKKEKEEERRLIELKKTKFKEKLFLNSRQSSINDLYL